MGTGGSRMVDNASVATKSPLGSFSSHGPAGGLRLVSAPGPGMGVNVLGGGLKLEAVMETLQRQQAARLERERRELRGLLEARLQQQQQQALALRHYQAAGPPRRFGLIVQLPPLPVRQASPALEQEEDYDNKEEELGAEKPTPPRYLPPRAQPPDSPQGAPRNPGTTMPGHSHSPAGAQGHHEWTYEKQFKQSAGPSLLNYNDDCNILNGPDTFNFLTLSYQP